MDELIQKRISDLVENYFAVILHFIKRISMIDTFYTKCLSAFNNIWPNFIRPPRV